MVIRVFKRHIINGWKWEAAIKRHNFQHHYHRGGYGKMLFITWGKYFIEVYFDRTQEDVGLGGTSRVFLTKSREKRILQKALRKPNDDQRIESWKD